MMLFPIKCPCCGAILEVKIEESYTGPFDHQCEICDTVFEVPYSPSLLKLNPEQRKELLVGKIK